MPSRLSADKQCAREEREKNIIHFLLPYRWKLEAQMEQAAIEIP